VCRIGAGDLGQIEVALKYDIGLRIKDARVLAASKKRFLIVFIIRNNGRFYEFLGRQWSLDR
jgi:hypothetical protein